MSHSADESWLRAEIKLAGCLLVLTPNLGESFYPALAELALRNDVKHIGTLGELSQFLLHDETISLIAERCAQFAEDILRVTKFGATVVWTVQSCQVGLIGDERHFYYGVKIQDFPAMLSALTSSVRGTVIRH